MKYYSKYPILTCAFLLLIPVIAQADQNADAIYREVVKEYQLHPDGSTTFTYSHEVKLLSKFAVNRRFGESFLIYNPDWQSLEIIRSVTTMKSGSAVPTPENGYNEVLPRNARDAAPYINFREMVVSHTGLEQDCSIDFAYRITNKAGFLPGLMGEEIFGDTSPIKKMLVRVIVPAGTHLSYKMLNASVSPEVTNADGNQVYTWSMTDLALIPAESSHAPFAEFAPRLIFSTVKLWDELIEYFTTNLEGCFELGEPAKEKAAALVEDIFDPKTRLLKLQQLVNDEIGLVKIDPALTGYRALSAGSCFNWNLGTYWDKTILLSAMLKQLNYKAVPCLISRYRQFEKSVPSLTQFGKGAVAVKGVSKEPFILLPAQKQTGLAEHTFPGRTLFSLKKQKEPFQVVEEHCHKCNRQSLKGTLVLNEKFRFSGKLRLQLGNHFNPAFSFMNNNDKAKKYFKTLVPGMKINQFTVHSLNEARSEFSAEFESSSALEELNGLIIWKLKDLPDGFNNMHISVASQNRTTPLDLPVKFSEEYKLNVKLPENVVTIMPDFQRQFENEVGSVLLQRKLDGNSMTIHKRLIIKKQRIVPAEYPQFRKLIAAWQQRDGSEIIFKKKM